MTTIDDLDELTRLRKLTARLLGVIRRHEWVPMRKQRGLYCPSCYGRKGAGHVAPCDIADALQEAGFTDVERYKGPHEQQEQHQPNS